MSKPAFTDSSPTPRLRRRRSVRLVLAGAAIAAIVVSIWLLTSPSRLPWQRHATTASSGAVSDGQGGYVLFAIPTSQSAGAESSPPKVGAPAPDFTLTGLDGTPVRLRDLRGKTVLINFWATWCGPCRQEFPELARAYQQQAGQGLVVLGVDVAESREQVDKFARDLGATFPIVIDTDSAIVHRYRVAGLPASFFIDRDGVIRAEQLGPLTAAGLTKKLAQAGLAGGDRP